MDNDLETECWECESYQRFRPIDRPAGALGSDSAQWWECRNCGDYECTDPETGRALSFVIRAA